MDSKTKLLEGVRVGDKFYHVNGEVILSDVNAACTMKYSFFDKQMTRYMPCQKANKLLLDRTHASKKELPLGENHLKRPSLLDSSYVPVMDINRERN